MSDSKSILDFLGPKKSFGFGFITAVVVIVAIGFVMQLGGGGSIFSNEEKVTTFGTPAADVDADDEAAGTDTAVADSVQLVDITSSDHIRGDLSTAEVVIVEFSDYDCPFCTKFHLTMVDVEAKYGDQVAWVFRHFPLDSLHPDARTKSEASECITELGGNDAFWAFTDIMFDDSRTVSVSGLTAIATELGISASDFDTCLAEERYADKVQAQYQDAVSSGGRGTPHSVIVTKDGKKLPISGAVPLEQVSSALDGIL